MKFREGQLIVQVVDGGWFQAVVRRVLWVFKKETIEPRVGPKKGEVVTVRAYGANPNYVSLEEYSPDIFYNEDAFRPLEANDIQISEVHKHLNETAKTWHGFL